MPSTSFVQTSIDLALLILVIEALCLGLYRARTGRGLSISTTLLITLSGIGLLFALRAAVAGLETFWILLGLSLGGLMHVIDLGRRIRNSGD
jgi:hypothetical protein